VAVAFVDLQVAIAGITERTYGFRTLKTASTTAAHGIVE